MATAKRIAAARRWPESMQAGDTIPSPSGPGIAPQNSSTWFIDAPLQAGLWMASAHPLRAG
jgi:hypothetical protein